MRDKDVQSGQLNSKEALYSTELDGSSLKDLLLQFVCKFESYT